MPSVWELAGRFVQAWWVGLPLLVAGIAFWENGSQRSRSIGRRLIWAGSLWLGGVVLVLLVAVLTSCLVCNAP